MMDVSNQNVQTSLWKVIDQPQFATCRSLLRSGPAASVSSCKYSSCGTVCFGQRRWENCFYQCRSMSQQEMTHELQLINSMKTQTNTALNALDSLLKTVPSDVLDKGKVAADSYRSSSENADVDISDPELKELQSIL